MIPLIRQQIIKRQDLQANPRVLYIFGDNLRREGMGGQAAEMRGEPNAFGFATKHAPGYYLSDYFHDSDSQVQLLVAKEWESLKKRIKTVQFWDIGGGGDHGGLTSTRYHYDAVVFPAGGIGTGLSKMQEYAPKALEQINAWINSIPTI